MPTWLARNFPRNFGTPEQQEAKDYQTLLYFLNKFNGIKNCYVSINGFEKDKIFLEQIAFDFDGNLDESLEECKKAYGTFRELKAEARMFFSGKKGFHLRVPIKTYITNTTNAKKITRAVQIGTSCSLETFDRHLLGDIKRILRFPNTKHLDTSLYCIEIDENWDIKRILKEAEKPRKLTSVNPKNAANAEDLLKAFSNAGLITEKQCNNNGIGNITVVKTQYNSHFITDEMLKKLFPQECYRKHLAQKNPPHTIRVGSCIWLVYLGYDLHWLLNFYRDIAYKYEWEDRENALRREKAIFDLFKRKYNPMSCGKIKERGYCMGGDCEWMKL